MTVAQLIAQLRHLVLEHPETSNMALVVQGIGATYSLWVPSSGVVMLGHPECVEGEVVDGTNRA